MLKKFFVLILTFLMLSSFLVTSVYAENESSEVPSDIAILEILTCTDGYTSLSVGIHEYSRSLTESIELKPNVGFHVYGVEINGVFKELDGNILTVDVELGKKVSVRPVFRGNVVFNIQQSSGGKLSPEGKVYVGAGKYFDIVATPDTGYICSGIYINDVGLEITKDGKNYKGSFKAPKETEYNVYATFEPVATHVVTLIKSEGGKIIPFDEEGKAYVFSGENAQFQAIPDEGYGIKSIIVNDKSLQWSADGVFTVENVTSDFNVSVEFVQMESIPVSINVIGKGNVTSATKAYANSKLILDITPDKGYELVSVKVNNAPTSLNKNGKLEINVTEEIFNLNSLKIDVVFDVIVEKFIIRAVVQNSIGGVITAEGYTIESMRTEVRKGSSITLKFTPDMNYRIEKVKVDDVEVELTSDNTFTLKNVTDNHRVLVYFTPDLNDGDTAFKISVESTSGGTVSPSSEQIVKQGDDITFVFTPNEGFKIDHVLVNGEKKEVTENYYTIKNVVSDQTLKVVFSEVSSEEGKIIWNENEIIVDISGSTVIDSDLLNILSNDSKGKNIIFKGNNYSWKFPSDVGLPSSQFDLKVLIGNEHVPENLLYDLEQKMVKNKIQGFEFETIKIGSLSLNDGVSLSISLGSDFAGKIVDYLKYDLEEHKFSSVIENINSEFDEAKYNSTQITVDSNGVAEIPFNNDEYIVLVVSSSSKFTLNVIAGENGSVSPRGPSLVSINSDQIIQITPDSGYKVEDIIVNGTSMYQEYVGRTTAFALTLGKINGDLTVEIKFSPSGEINDNSISGDNFQEGGLNPLAVTLIIIGIAIIGGIILFIYKWNEEKDIVD